MFGRCLRRGQCAVAVTAVAVALLAGCATQVRTSPQPLPDQRVKYHDGTPMVFSYGRTLVAVSPSNPLRSGTERPRFVVTVGNATDEPFDFDSTNITASLNGRALAVFTFEEVAAEIRKRDAISAALTAFGGALESAGARQQGSRSSFSGSYQSNGSGGSTYGAYTGTIRNSSAGQAAAAEVDARTDARVAAIRSEGESAVQTAARTMLKRTTIEPRKAHTGEIVIASFDVPPEGGALEIKVTISGEVHRFSFTQSRGSQ